MAHLPFGTFCLKNGFVRAKMDQRADPPDTCTNQPKMPTCCAILLSGARKGHVCNKNTRGENIRCGTHENCFLRAPINVAIREIDAYLILLKRRADNVFIAPLYVSFVHNCVNPWQTNRETLILNTDMAVQNPAQWKFPYGPMEDIAEIIEMVELEERIAPGQAAFNAEDAPAPRRPRRAPRRNVQDVLDDIRAADAAVAAAAAAAPAAPAAPPPPPVQELAAFAADKQNVHTTQSVNMTKEVVERVLKIAVPKEYRWNMDITSKTVGEIITECKLTLQEMAEMMNRYMRDDDVYEMGRGIYGKVLDGVWQYIRNSPDKADMCRILKQELKDNIGMCAQGNLTRLCNVLAGYMDGIGPQESVTERLGRELPMLMDDEDRITKAKMLMQSLNVPEADWVPWLDALA